MTELHKRIEKIENDICDIRDNHLSCLKNDLTETKTNVSWLLKFFWIIATTSIGGLITSLFTALK